MMSDERRHEGGEAAAYALGALTEAEAAAFEAHLADCPECAEGLAELTEVVHVLPMAVTQRRAPRSLRRRVLREVRDAARESSARSTVRGAGASSRRGWFGPAAGALVAALCVAVIVFTAVGGFSGSGPSTVPTTVVQARVSGIAGRAQVREAGSHGALVVRGLTPPANGRIYQVWFERPGRSKPESASVLFGVDAAGDAAVGLPGNIRHVSAVLVTSEPLGGTRAPTVAPVITAGLT